LLLFNIDIAIIESDIVLILELSKH